MRTLSKFPHWRLHSFGKKFCLSVPANIRLIHEASPFGNINIMFICTTSRQGQCFIEEVLRWLFFHFFGFSPSKCWFVFKIPKSFAAVFEIPLVMLRRDTFRKLFPCEVFVLSPRRSWCNYHSCYGRCIWWHEKI